MVRKVKKKKSGMRLFAAFLLMIAIAAFVYKSIIVTGNNQISEKEYNDKTPSYSSLKITPDSSDDRTTPVPPSKIKPNPSASISSVKLNSPNAILIRLDDNTILMQKNSEEKIYPASLTKINESKGGRSWHEKYPF